MIVAMNRLEREHSTLSAMVRIYCRGQHAAENGLCAECSMLLAYARTQLARCPFHHEKPTCAQCVVHCYREERREEIQAIMRHAGPRMLWRHPVLTIGHMLDGLRNRRMQRR